MSEIIYSNVTFKQNMNKDAGPHGEMSKEPEEDVTYSEIRIGVKEQVKAEKEKDSCCGDPSVPVGSKVVTPKRECQKVALVTLVCFCVVLLALVIVLGVLYMLNKSLQDDLAKMHNALTGQRDQLTSDLQQVKNNLSLVSDLLAAAKEKRCASGWEFFNGSCYYFSNNSLTWEQSTYACIRDGGHLVIIESLQEQDFLRKKVVNPPAENSYWIGLTDIGVEGTWVWIDNTNLNENIKYWDLNNGTSNEDKPEPNDWEQAEDCAQMGQRCSGQISCWFDVSCDQPSKRICEHRATERTT